MVPPFNALPAAAATVQERLDWLDAVRARPTAEIVQNLYEVERIFSSLPDTKLGATTTCPTRTAIQAILDTHAHCSDPCPICGVPHCLPRNAAAKQELTALKASLETAEPWKKAADEHLKIVDALGADITVNGNKGTLNGMLEKFQAGAMIGALRCVDPATNAMVTIYGATGSQPKGTDANSRLATPDLKALSPPIAAAGDFLTMSGQPEPLLSFRGHGNPPGACAAQRMLQEALSRNLRPTGLSEMWFGADKLDGVPRLAGHEYASCPTCKSVLATVLCPARP